MKSGCLTIVGTGIQLVGQVTLAAKAWIEQADKVLYAVADPATAEWLRSLNPTAESLPYNTHNQWRKQTYKEMVEVMLSAVRQELNVCAVFYGHPGVFANPTREAMKQAQEEGFRTQMLPGISASDCLFADLGVDPGQYGCQSFEATDFLIRDRQFNPRSGLILWQIGLIGNLSFFDTERVSRGLKVLTEVLEKHYHRQHEVIVYEAAVYHPVCPPIIQRMPLFKLPESQVSEVSTLYVPPQEQTPADRSIMARLGMVN
ncbi:MAG: SAM-dependent methyltransferase [Cyanobacteria bacterium P01_E01_bin.42]